MGLSDTRVSTPERRDRILLVGATAAALLTLLGAAGEAVGEDRRMKANTSKERTHSLLNQGLYYFDRLPGLREERSRPLMAKFDELLRQHATFREFSGLISGDGSAFAGHPRVAMVFRSVNHGKRALTLDGGHRSAYRGAATHPARRGDQHGVRNATRERREVQRSANAFLDSGCPAGRRPSGGSTCVGRSGWCGAG
jgi:hypothetical protein